MFTGIIEEIGEISSIRKLTDGLRLTLKAGSILEDIKIDDSVNIDGACQTVVEVQENSFSVEAVGETLQKTTFGGFKPGRQVNLERALTLQTRLGGHLVQGHVNQTGTVKQFFPRGENYFLQVEIPQNLKKYVIEEGSIAINGISLTVADLNDSLVGISIIPHTVKNTTLQWIHTGDRVNIEVDLIARYLEKLANPSGASSVTLNKLQDWGY
ncbi:MAG: riboflavin synthase [Calditrichia bacterium]